MFGAAITAIGSYVPERILDNNQLENMVDTTDEWIVRRTGIKERRISADNEFTSHLCERAIRDLENRYDKNLDDVDMIITCTHTPDFPFPSVSCLLQERFGIEQSGAIDLNATCAGFVYGLQVAQGMIASGMYRKVVVLGADTMSKITDYTDRSNCILFGDGAGAVLVERDEKRNSFLAHIANSDGKGAKHAYRTGFAKSLNTVELDDSGFFIQNGREVYKWAVSQVPEGMNRLVEKANLSLSDIDWFVPHSANLRMIESICEKSGFPKEDVLQSVDVYGNTSAASIPLSLDRGVRSGKVTPEHIVLMYGFGAGLVEAGLLAKLYI